MSKRLSLIVSSRHRYPMKSRQTQSWLRPGELLARLFSAPDDDRAASLQSIFRFDSAEIWRLGQQLRSQYLTGLLHRKVGVGAVHGSCDTNDTKSNRGRHLDDTASAYPAPVNAAPNHIEGWVPQAKHAEAGAAVPKVSRPRTRGAAQGR